MTTEQSVQAIWVSVLGVGSDDGRTFYELGGDSLQAITLIYEIEEQLGVEIELAAFLEDGTLPGLVREVAKDRQPPR